MCVILWLCSSVTSSAQNLVPNHGLEDVFDCSGFLDCDPGDQSPCPPWICLNSINFFNSCSTIPAFDVPYNFRGFQFAHSGEGYVGGYQKYAGFPEWPQVQLIQPLTAATCYTASMYVNLSDESCGIANLGMLFTTLPTVYATGQIPQVEGSGQFLSDTMGWMLISGSFIALGGEEYLTLGNFYTNAQTPYDPDCAPGAVYAYYYFDDILVEESTTEVIDVDLGGPFEQCDFVILDATQQDEFSYLWSDGSTSPTLIATTSGTYSVTVYDHQSCSAGIGETDVVVLGSLPVNLGPDTILCQGESLTITLNEDLGEYVWADGSTDTEYTISNPGTYAVTFDDGCDITIDHIVVSYLEAPEFTLGEDTILCPGETYWLSMDPDLGDYLWDNNSSAPNYLFDEPGLYALTISNQCGEYSDQIEIAYVDPPLFDLGPDSTVFCTGNTINIQLDPQLGEFLWSDGTTDPDYIIAGTGVYSLTVSNICGTLMDELYAEQISVPVVVLGGSIELCSGESEILDPGYNYGDYVWQDGSTDQEYEVTSSGIYSITVTNLCGMASATVVAEVAPTLIPPDLGPDVSQCPGEPLILTVVDQGASILWNDLTTNDSLLVTASGTYYVEVSTFCESYADTIVIVVQNSPPSVNLPNDFALCQGQSVTLDAGIGNVTYLWNDGSQLSQVTVNSPGVYSLTVSSACGTDVDSVMIVSGGPAPEVSLGQDTAICPAGTITLYPSFANVDAWSWPDGSDTTFFIASTAGQVFVEASNECGIAYDTIQISLLPAVPSLDLGRDSMICPGETVMLSILISDVSITWPDGSGNQVYSVTDSSIVIASISNACGVSTDSLEVGLHPDIPFLNLGPDQTLCPGESITVEPGIADVVYLWQDGSTSSTFQTNQPDTIILTISNLCGSVSDTLMITESNIGPQLDLGPDIHACVGTTVTIPAGILGVNYLWQDGSTGSDFVTTIAGIVFLTVNNLCGMDSDTIIVDITGSPPAVMFGPDTTLCFGEVLTLYSSVDSLTTSLWQDGSTGQQFDVSASGVFHLTESNLCGTDSDTIAVEINGVIPVTNLGPDTILCDGMTVLLTTSSDPGIINEWQDGFSGLSFLVNSPGLYSLHQHNECGEDTDTINVTFQSPPSPFNIGADTLLCSGETLLLTAPLTTDQLKWQDGSMATSYLATIEGLYSLTVQNDCGERKDEMNLTFADENIQVALEDHVELCPEESIVLDATQTFTANYLWNTGSILPSLSISTPGTYSVTVRSDCEEVTQTVIVSEASDCITDSGIYIPNVFSPNGDHINDQFIIMPGPGIEIVSIEGSIYDRWGGVVFHSEIKPFTWDGRFGGEYVLPGVYVYQIKVNYLNDNQEYSNFFAGDVTVLR